MIVCAHPDIPDESMLADDYLLGDLEQSIYRKTRSAGTMTTSGRKTSGIGHISKKLK